MPFKLTMYAWDPDGPDYPWYQAHALMPDRRGIKERFATFLDGVKEHRRSPA